MKIGNTYRVEHARKGTFIGRCESFDEKWITFTIVEGRARMIGPVYDGACGDEVVVRADLCSCTEVEL